MNFSAPPVKGFVSSTRSSSSSGKRIDEGAISTKSTVDPKHALQKQQLPKQKSYTSNNNKYHKERKSIVSFCSKKVKSSVVANPLDTSTSDNNSKNEENVPEEQLVRKNIAEALAYINDEDEGDEYKDNRSAIVAKKRRQVHNPDIIHTILLSSSAFLKWDNTPALILCHIMYTVMTQAVPALSSFLRKMRRKQQRQLLLLNDATAAISSQSSSSSIGISSNGKKINGIHGIRNYGQTCFMNSVLQALASLPLFLDHLKDHLVLQHNCVENDTTQMLWSVLQAINGNRSSAHHPPIDPRPMLESVGKYHVQFCRRRLHHFAAEQQDAQEFLQALMDTLIQDRASNAKNDHIDIVTETNKLPKAPMLTNGSNNKALSLSGFLNQVQEELCNTTVHASVAKEQQQNANENGEEKKQDDTDLETSSLLIIDGHQEESVSYVNLTSSQASPSPQTSTKIESNQRSNVSQPHCDMKDSISSITPSPIHGWIGSTLQCAKCNYVRPIQNAPCLDIPIVPSAISSMNSPSGKPGKVDETTSCRLETCLRNYTSIEKVSDVECLNCTKLKEIQHWEEEMDMLQGAMISLRNKKRPTETLELEYRKAECLYHFWKARNPDHDINDNEVINKRLRESSNGHNYHYQEEQIGIVRGDAWKCLLVTRPPAILCLHIQRRYYDPIHDCMVKTKQHVQFDLELNLGPFCATHVSSSNKKNDRSKSSRLMYKLYAILEHAGNAYSGHYVTYRRMSNGNDDKWCLISDDSIATDLPWSRVRTAQAYMLFYEQVSTPHSEKALQIKPKLAKKLNTSNMVQ